MSRITSCTPESNSTAAISEAQPAGGALAICEALLYSPPAGWSSLMAAVLLLSGVQLVILGIVGEYLGRLYLTANKKPQAVVKEVRQSRTLLPIERRALV